MKKISWFILSFVIVVLLNACSASKQTTTTATEEDISQAIDSSKWIFTPTRMIPMADRSREVFGADYSVIYAEKKLTIYLPYYGRAYAGADVLSTTGPLDFISKDFVIEQQQIKQAQWEITIKPNDNKEVRIMVFTFFGNGSANLNVTMQNRSSISFTGTIAPFKK